MEEHSPVDLTFEEPNPQAKNFFDTLSTTNNSLYAGCKNYSQMSIIGRMANLKTDHNCSEKMYNDMCILMRKALPQPNSMTSSFYDTKKQITGLGLPSKRIDCCINGCMIYWGHSANARRCRTCSTTRWVREDVGNRRIPMKQFIYLLIGQRLQRLYVSRVTAGKIRWYAEHHIEKGEMCHPSDSEAWQHFNATHPEFAAEIRNVRFGLCTDGFNPFGSSGRQYSSWPVILTP